MHTSTLVGEVLASLRDMLEAGAICPSQSPWCNAVVLVRNKDGTLHFCVDFRRLNTWMKKVLYHLPHIQEVLESMVGSAHFSSMDLKSGFWQIKMAPESQQYMAFTVGNLRFYEFTCMLFGLCNTPATFQHLMQNTLGELNLMYCVIYLDDVIVFGRTEEEHLEHLHVVFKRFWEALALKVLVFPVRNCLLGSPHLAMGHPAEPRQRVIHGGIPNARDLHAGPHILWISGTLLAVYQGIHQHSAPLV